MTKGRPSRASRRLLLTAVGRQVRHFYNVLNQRTGGWLAIFKHAYVNFRKHECNVRAAAMAYYTLFAIFPLMLLLVAVSSSLLAQPAAQSQALSLVLQYFPSPELANVVTRQVDLAFKQRGTVSILAGIGLLWSASGMFSIINTALNVAWNVQHPRPFWRDRIMGLVIVFLVGVLSLISVIATAVINAGQLLLRSGVVPFGQLFNQASSHLVPIGISTLMFALLYRTLPYTWVSWRSAVLGAVVAAIIWEGTKTLFTLYFLGVAQSRYSAVYGSLGSVIVFLLWAYFTGIILLVGAELAAAYSAYRDNRQQFRLPSGNTRRRIT